MPLTTNGVYYPDNSTPMSLATITAAMATSIDAAIVKSAKIVQVQAFNNSTPLTNSTTNYNDTGLTGTITPSSVNSKILVLVAQNGVTKSAGNAGNGVNLQLARNGSAIQTFALNLLNNGAAQSAVGSASTFMLDSPGVDTPVTYSTKFANNVAAANVGVQTGSITSTLILIEVGA